MRSRGDDVEEEEEDAAIDAATGSAADGVVDCVWSEWGLVRLRLSPDEEVTAEEVEDGVGVGMGAELEVIGGCTAEEDDEEEGGRFSCVGNNGEAWEVDGCVVREVATLVTGVRDSNRLDLLATRDLDSSGL